MTVLFIFNNFPLLNTTLSKEQLIFKMPYMFNKCNLMSLEVSIFINHLYNLCCKHIHHLQKFSFVIAIIFFLVIRTFNLHSKF